jgi:hypothetical protein
MPPADHAKLAALPRAGEPTMLNAHSPQSRRTTRCAITGTTGALVVACCTIVGACTNMLGKFEVGDHGAGGSSSATVGAGGTATSTAGAGGTASTASGATTSTANVAGSGGGMDGMKRAFVTNVSFSSNFGGANAAHWLCQKAANAANLGGEWVAWIAEGNKTIVCSGGPWVLVDGKAEVGTCSDLMAGKLQHPIDLSETKQPPAGAIYVWTGLALNGKPTGADCTEWTSLQANATVGSIKRQDSQWTDAGPHDCAASAHLYCFEN